jgi:hypothetical protein
MPTLLELFESKQYLEYNNQTAKQYNEIKNSKDSTIESLDPIVQKLGASSLNEARKKNSQILSETVDEVEKTGLLIYGQNSSVPLYGSDIIRIDNKTTGLITSMRTLNKLGVGGNFFTQAASAIGADIAGAGITGLGQAIAGVPSTFSGTSLLTKAGSQLATGLSSLLPDVLIPSKVVSIFNPPTSGLGKLGRNLTSKLTDDGMIQSPSNLEAIRKASDTFGSLESVGSKLLQSAGGTTQQGKNRLISAGLSIAEEKTKKFAADKITKLLTKRKEQSGQGSSAQKHVNLNAKIEYTPSLKYANLDGKVGSDSKKPIGYINRYAELEEDQGGLAEKYQLETVSGSVFNETPEYKVFSQWGGSSLTPLDAREAKHPIKYSKLMNDTMPTFETKRRIKTWRASSELNAEYPYKPDDVVALTKKLKENGIVDDLDVLPLKFYSIQNGVATNFLATITGLTETFTPTWDPSKFIGNAFNVYTYGGVERSVQFNFKVFSFNEDEHIAAWSRLSFLSSLTYPQGYTGKDTIAVVPPLIKFTLGDMYKNKEGFIESLIYTVDDNTPWDIGIDSVNNPAYVAKNYRLPKIVDVGVTIKMLESKDSTYTAIPVDIKAGDSVKTLGDKLYAYSKNTYEPPISENKDKQGDSKKEDPKEAASKMQNNPEPVLVDTYKGYKIYKKQQGPFIQFFSKFEERVVRKGPESRSASDAELLAYEKTAIDSRISKLSGKNS